MSMNLANAQKKVKNNKRSEEILNAIDWSATTDVFRLCVASIREDIEGFTGLLRKVAQQEEDLKGYLREWPVFDWVRDCELVQNEIERIFGEPLVASGDNDKRSESEPEDGVSD